MNTNSTDDGAGTRELGPVMGKQVMIPRSSRQPLSTQMSQNGSSIPTSAFGSRFHRPGQRNVYFRKEPDLTSDPRQIWVALDTSEIKFKNYTLNNFPYKPGPALLKEENEVEGSSFLPKRRKLEPKAHKTPPASGFRVNNPLKTDVHEDVWRIILKKSHPRVLLTVKDLSRKFHQLLQEQSIWKASRINLDGEHMPDPPGKMSEQRYAHLLYGYGCDFQRSKCGSNVTKKVYWPFRLRMCDSCLRRKTQKDKAIPAFITEQLGHDIGDLIPAGMTNSGKYIRTRQPIENPWGNTSRAIYLRSDLDSILSEYRDLVQAGNSDVSIDRWRDQKRTESRALMAQCTLIEDFQRRSVASQPKQREARAAFFAVQAGKLTPPLAKDVMERMMPYKMSLDSTNEPTLRSWAELRAKLLPLRSAAEELYDLCIQNSNYRRMGQLSPDIRHYRTLHSLRSRQMFTIGLLPEEIFVRDLGRQQLYSCQNRGVADADLVLLVLRGVYDAYQSLPTAARPRGTNGDGLKGVYRLTLDDARMILQQVIEPEVRSWDDPPRARATLEMFKCIGCVRKDCTTRYSFEALFVHLLEKHAIYVTEGEDYHKLYRAYDDCLYRIDFPWYTVEWPKSLPIAASHHSVSKEQKWLADADVAYIPASPPEVESAFLNRRPCNNVEVAPSDFPGNLCYAAAKLRTTRLNAAAQVRITLQYALDRYAIVHGSVKPSLTDFDACLPALQAVNEDFNLTFTCGLCKEKGNARQSSFHARPEMLPKMKEHFEKTHFCHDWTESLLDLPTDTGLASVLKAADAELREEKRATAQREASLGKNLRKKPDPNAKIILQKPESTAIFNELFPRVDVTGIEQEVEG